jgi:DNA-binding NarL/FixJ family response regulator
MTDFDSTDAGKRVNVVIGGDQLLLNKAVFALLEADGRIDARCSKPGSPELFARDASGIPAVGIVGVLVDPLGREWEAAADSLRRNDSHFGLIVLTARPSFGKQRRWRHASEPGVDRANGLLAIGSDPGDLVEAILDAHRRPRARSPFWLDGPRHPFAFGRTESGRAANELRANAKRHEILVLEALGKPRGKIAQRMDIHPDQVKAHLNKAMKALGARNEVELGRLATENGLLDDLDDDSFVNGR